nr:MAG: replication associated protein [Arizlama virus]
MSTQGSLCKHWCFTVNNYEDGEDRLDWLTGYEYCVAGKEVAPDTGTRHLQGYVCFDKRKRLTALKKIHKDAHWEITRGTPQQASDYCKKDGDFVEKGTLPNAKGANGGEATAEKYKRAYELAKSGNLEDIEKDLLTKHYNTYKRIRTDNQPKIVPLSTLLHEWHYGPTGTGKSRAVREKYPDAFIKDANHWWDGYNGEKVVIIEDVDKYDVKLGRYLKLWGDHYAFPADMKNQGKLDIRPEKVIITSNYTPREIWEDDKTSDPIMRRYRMISYYDVIVPPSDAPSIVMSAAFHNRIQERVSTPGIEVTDEENSQDVSVARFLADLSRNVNDEDE